MDIWSELISNYPEEFIEYYIPTIYNDVDFTKKIEFIDNKKLKIVDRIMEVSIKNDANCLILCHVETHGDYKTSFGERMSQYYDSIYEKFKMPIISIAIITPHVEAGQQFNNTYSINYLGNKIVEYTYNVVDTREIDFNKCKNSKNVIEIVSGIFAKTLDYNEIDKLIYIRRQIHKIICESKNTNNKLNTILEMFIEMATNLSITQIKLYREQIAIEMRNNLSNKGFGRTAIPYILGVTSEQFELWMNSNSKT